jgi:hypothetical protein
LAHISVHGIACNTVQPVINFIIINRIYNINGDTSWGQAFVESKSLLHIPVDQNFYMVLGGG